MAVMARAVGIPARTAVGYAGGEYDEELDGYLVRRSNAHTWVEIYFPDYGWIEFEPTAGEPPIVWPRPVSEEEGGITERPERERPDLRDKELPEEPEVPPGAAGRVPWYRVGILWPVVTILLLAAGSVFGLLWWRRREDLPAAETLFRRMVLYSRLLGLKPQATQTPTEYANLVVEEVPEAKEGALRLAELYLQEWFSREGLTSLERMEAYAIWKGLRRAISQRLPARIYQLMGSIAGLVRPPLGEARGRNEGRFSHFDEG